MSSSRPANPTMQQDKVDFTRETFYSLLNDTATDCNNYCGAGNQTCFKNCVVKNKQLIEVMRDFLLYSTPKGVPQ